MQLNNAFKKFEGRLYKGSIKNLVNGEIIYIRYKTELILVKIVKIRKFNNFKELLTFSENSLKDTLPFVNNLKEGIKLYRNIYNKYKIIDYGTVSIKIEII